MNRLANRSKEVTPQTNEPHTARRAIRYRAADNTQQAIARQFPGMFAVQMSTTTQQQGQYQAVQQGANDVAQAA